jgi:acetylserotonin N-methyltransferase
MSGVHKVFDLLNGFRKSKVLFAATKLKIFDTLSAVGPSTPNMLANSLGLNEQALSTLLHSCASLELLEKDKELNKFFVGDFAKKYLVSSSPESLSGYIMHSNEVVYNLFSVLESSIKTGTTCWKDSRILNCKAEDKEEDITKNAFSQLYKDEESLQRFLRGMHGISVSCSPSLVSAFDLSKFSRLVDLGGGSGALVFAACQQYPNLHGSVFDLSSTLSFSQASLLRQSGDSPLIMQRISLIPGNFFVDPLPEADIFVLSRIIHDWDETKAMVLLKKIYDKLPNGGAVLVCEMLLNEDGCGPADTLLQSLNMLVQTGGTERKFSEYKSLLASAGFKDVNFKKTGQYLDAIFAIKG